MVEYSLRSFTLFHKVLRKSMAPSLPQIRVSDMEILSDWDFENVKAFGDCIPGYRSSASMSFLITSALPRCCSLWSLFMKGPHRLSYTHADRSISLPDNPPLQPPSIHLPLRFSVQQSRLHPYLLCIFLHHASSISHTVTSLDQHDCWSNCSISPTRAKSITHSYNIYCSVISRE